MNNHIQINYYQNTDLTWDSYYLGDTIAKDSKSLEHARVITDIVLTEELGNVFIQKETINYYHKE
jgi:hypothetical protein